MCFTKKFIKVLKNSPHESCRRRQVGYLLGEHGYLPIDAKVRKWRAQSYPFQSATMFGVTPRDQSGGDGPVFCGV